MDSKISLDRLHVDCNIGALVIHGLTIHARPGAHTVVIADVMPGTEGVDYISGSISGQPLAVRVDESIIFYGVIHTVTENRQADFLMLRITAYSLSWLLDLEYKSRSFQKVRKQHAEIIGDILKEYDSYAIENFADKAIEKPLIQYKETDWEFIRRVASRCGVQVIAADRLDYPGLYIGVPESAQQDELARLSAGSRVLVGNWEGIAPTKRANRIDVGDIRIETREEQEGGGEA